MHWLQDYPFNKSQQTNLSLFLKRYGISGLMCAIQSYTDMQQEYICKTRASLSRLKINDIFYLEIQEHTIAVHTQRGIYQKYGSLSNELKHLSPCGFMKCNQSCIVSIRKIQTICNDDIILTNEKHLHLSRHYAPQIIMAFSRSFPL